MDFTLTPDVVDFRDRVRVFVDEHLIPLEKTPDAYDKGENLNESLLQSLREQVRQANLWCLQMPKHRGGQGLGPAGMAV